MFKATSTYFCKLAPSYLVIHGNASLIRPHLLSAFAPEHSAVPQEANCAFGGKKAVTRHTAFSQLYHSIYTVARVFRISEQNPSTLIVTAILETTRVTTKSVIAVDQPIVIESIVTESIVIRN